jgi:hypothetical protein
MSSTSSVNRTMNPSDKYLNPRPVPQPSLPRLNTSPAPRLDPISATSSAIISPWSGLSPPSSQPVSQPTSASALRMFKLPRKTSVDGVSRSVSPQSRIGGLRAKFGSFKASRADSPEDLVRGRPGEPEMELNISGPIMQHRATDNRSVRSGSNASSPASSRQASPHPIAELETPGAPGSYFALRRPLEPTVDSDEVFTTVSFQQHRRQRSRSKEPSNLRRSLSLSDEGDDQEPVLNVTTSAYQPLETLKEVASAQNTPTWPVTAKRIQVEFPLRENILEKRLPTLPNTPSSAYPPSIYSDSPAKQLDKQIEALQSHFSNSTMESVPTFGDDEPCPGISHFSSWTMSTETSSQGSNYSGKQSECGSDSMHHTRMSSFSVLSSPFESKSAETLVPELPARSPEQLTSTTSCSTISSTLSTSPSSPESESFEFEHNSLDTNVNNAIPQASTPTHLQAYRLPDLSPEGNGPSTCVKATPQEHFPPHDLAFTSPMKSEFEIQPVPTIQNKHDKLDSTFAHSQTMQQLLQELSYLGDLIQN